MVKNKLTIHGATAAQFTIVKDSIGYYILNNAVIMYARRDTIGYKKLGMSFEAIRFNHKIEEVVNGLKIRLRLVDRYYKKFYFFVNSNYIKGES